MKNFNWIKDQIGNDQSKNKKLERPCTRGGEQRGQDFSFVEKETPKDFTGESSYLDRPGTRSKPRRPASRQVRLNKRVNHIRGVRVDSESYRGELGDCNTNDFKDSFQVNRIEKVIPDSTNSKIVKESASPIKIVNKETFVDRKRSLRDSTSLDPKLKVNKSINFNRKHSNEPIRKETNNKNPGPIKHFIVGDLNRSIESIQIKNKKAPSDKIKETIFHFKSKKNELY